MITMEEQQQQQNNSNSYPPILVVNKRNRRLHGVATNNVYIGRGNRHMKGSPLGNPFKMKSEHDRDYVVEQYDAWLTNEMTIQNSPARNEICRLVDIIAKKQNSSSSPLNLICWCAPKRCHGDIVKRKIMEELVFCQPTTDDATQQEQQPYPTQDEGPTKEIQEEATVNPTSLLQQPTSNSKKTKRKNKQRKTTQEASLQHQQIIPQEQESGRQNTEDIKEVLVKKRRKLLKKLREIEQLRKTQSSEKTLNEDQKRKVDSEQSVIQELQEVATQLGILP